MVQAELNYIDFVGIPINKKSLVDLAKETLSESKYSKNLENKNICIDIAVIDEVEMKRVNSAYRGKDLSTDVISIGEYSDNLNIENETKHKIILGEVLLCWSDIKKNATIQHTGVIYEFAYVYTHGILHLLGYKHGKDMFSLQAKLSSEFCDKIEKNKNEVS